MFYLMRNNNGTYLQMLYAATLLNLKKIQIYKAMHKTVPKLLSTYIYRFMNVSTAIGFNYNFTETSTHLMSAY